MSHQLPIIAIPIQTLALRYENHIEAMHEARSALPWWSWRERMMLSGAIGAYRHEADTVLEMGGELAMRSLAGNLND